MSSRARRRWSALSLRTRLTAVFAAVMVVALGLTGFLVYTQFRQDLDTRIDEELVDRQHALTGLVATAPIPQEAVDQAGEPLAQVYGPKGGLSASTRALGATALIAPRQVAAARRAAVTLTRSNVPGIDDGVRARAFPLTAGRVAVVAEGLADRERALHRLALILTAALPVALVVASFAGYRVAAAALRPVDRMRARAQAIGAGDLHERLPEPGGADEIDRLAVTLNDLLARLDRAFEHERRLVGDASHELRTPISVLRTRLDVALRQEHDLESLRRVLADAHDDSRRLSRLADDLLLLARADQGRVPLRPEPLAVDELLSGAAARGREVAAAAGRTITVRRGGGADAVVLADPDRTAQVLDNLVFNSLRHGGGSIELAAERQGGLVVIRVGDDGPGYPEEFLDRAFERFSQADPGRAGAGLGLAIAEAITTAQGGTIAAANRPEGGAVTTVTLPAA